MGDWPIFLGMWHRSPIGYRGAEVGGGQSADGEPAAPFGMQWWNPAVFRSPNLLCFWARGIGALQAIDLPVRSSRSLRGYRGAEVGGGSKMLTMNQQRERGGYGGQIRVYILKKRAFGALVI